MKKLYSITIAAGLALALSGCGSQDASTPSKPAKVEVDPMTLDVRKVCDVKTNGVAKVLASAKTHNATAQKHGVEFRRLGVDNSNLIAGIDKALKDGAKEFTPLDFKGKATKEKFTVEYATQRACKFAISALTQEAEGKTEWRLAVPGDGFKY